MYPSTFQQHIETLLKRSSLRITSFPWARTRVDYTFIDGAGRRVALEIKGLGFRPEKKHFDQLRNAVEPIALHVDEFMLVTPSKPSAAALESLKKVFEPLGIKIEWLSGEEFEQSLGPREVRYARRSALEHSDTVSYNDFNRQLSESLIRKLQRSNKAPEAFLRIGERVPAVIVLSDLKSFSLLSKATKPDDLNDFMSKYYRVARDLVWAHGGVLDKFIGDAVLAIFGYPSSTATAQSNAAKFAADLIEIGKQILTGLNDLINEAIETGTRVGISTGEISVLNIGTRSIELSFVGDVINLASRLEHECDVNACLMDNLTKVAISNNDRSLLKRLFLEGRQLRQEQVKGQLTSIQTWQVPSTVIPSISDLEKALTLNSVGRSH